MTATTRTVGVIGGGRMGAGIAHGLLMAGFDTILVERDEESVGLSRARVDRYLEKSDDQADKSTLIGRLSAGCELASLEPCEAVIEAVPEDVNMKRDLFTRLEDVCSVGALICTNTSAISVEALAGALRHPQRFLGLHFFNPVPTSALVEVIHGAATSKRTIDAALELVRLLGKQPVVVADSPGFASSRLGIALALEAIRMVEEGVASPGDIDAAMTLGYRHATGPLATTDLVGLDVRLDIAEYLNEQLGARFAPPALLRRMVAEGRLGKKTGEGFFEWA